MTQQPAKSHRLYRLPGGRLAAGTPCQAARLAVAAAWYLGPGASRVIRAGRENDWKRLHQRERRWGQGVSDALRIRYDISGAEHVDPLRRQVVVALHEGFADALALLRLGLDLGFVARDELYEWPILGRYLHASQQVVVEEGSPRRSYPRLVEEGRRILDDGRALVVFPQGSILGIEIAFWGGAFRLAERLDAWILPVALTGSHRIWEYPYSPQVRFGERLSMRVMAPVPPERAVAEAVVIEADLKQVAWSGAMAPPRRFVPERDGFWDDYRYQIDPAFPELAARVAARRAGR